MDAGALDGGDRWMEAVGLGWRGVGLDGRLDAGLDEGWMEGWLEAIGLDGGGVEGWTLDGGEAVGVGWRGGWMEGAACRFRAGWRGLLNGRGWTDGGPKKRGLDGWRCLIGGSLEG